MANEPFDPEILKLTGEDLEEYIKYFDNLRKNPEVSAKSFEDALLYGWKMEPWLMTWILVGLRDRNFEAAAAAEAARIAKEKREKKRQKIRKNFNRKCQRHTTEEDRRIILMDAIEEAKKKARARAARKWGPLINQKMPFPDSRKRAHGSEAFTSREKDMNMDDFLRRVMVPLDANELDEALERPQLQRTRSAPRKIRSVGTRKKAATKKKKKSSRKKGSGRKKGRGTLKKLTRAGSAGTLGTTRRRSRYSLVRAPRASTPAPLSSNTRR